MKFIMNLLVVALTISVFSSCNDDDNVFVEDDPTIAELAQQTDNLSILVEALTRANLVDVLDNENGDFISWEGNN